MRLPSTLRIVDRVFALGVLAPGAAGAYLGLLSALSFGRKASSAPSERSFVSKTNEGLPNLAVVVPAHNEALLIADTVANLLAVDYPAPRWRVVVVADNCDDATAAVARHAGAEVFERNDPIQRGKGFALAFAFERLLAERWADAIVVVDADSQVSSNLLRSFADRLDAGESAMQASYQVSNVGATWRTTLMSIAFSCMHDVRSKGRERLGLSTGLRGNGMCFSADSLRLVPHKATSLVEDVEHGLDLAERGIRVAFVADAWVKAEMPEQAAESTSQRQRWERGRSKMRRERLGRLVRESITAVDPVRADLAVDLAIPPLARVVVMLGGASLVVAVARLVTGKWSAASVPLAVGCVGLAGHVGAGWRESGTGLDGIRALAQVPNYVLWKFRVADASPKQGTAGKKDLLNDSQIAEDWVRTTRNAERPTERETDVDVRHLN